ncbi:hypothetical protein [Parasphaerochaeta coccoides]|uniref:Major facilitator transporter n=1 Tax=Parasphaerochaeta coccoides (strain ATCC BAA-1237 / DSM 17374 / SPN1) TaxID=760011 RepID=F4GLY3_PARC1|nr:hypothetical protein [Parasphaerochaeta coccoides]AEC03024.1 major facilitator transporter [Parasphaerochaeta coccoides DSM 17374]
MAKGKADVTKNMNNPLVLQILVGVLFLILGILGLQEKASAVSQVYDLFKGDLRFLQMVLAVIILVAGLLQLLPLFVSALPGSLKKVSGLVILIVWLAVVFLGNIVPAFDGALSKDFIGWLYSLIVNLIVLSAIASIKS